MSLINEQHRKGLALEITQVLFQQSGELALKSGVTYAEVPLADNYIWHDYIYLAIGPTVFALSMSHILAKCSFI